jgi:hypothetical protein
MLVTLQMSTEIVWATLWGRHYNAAPFPRHRNWGSEKSDFLPFTQVGTGTADPGAQGPPSDCPHQLPQLQLAFFSWRRKLKAVVGDVVAETGLELGPLTSSPKLLLLLGVKAFGSIENHWIVGKGQAGLFLVMASFLPCLLNPTKLQTLAWSPHHMRTVEADNSQQDSITVSSLKLRTNPNQGWFDGCRQEGSFSSGVLSEAQISPGFQKDFSMTKSFS